MKASIVFAEKYMAMITYAASSNTAVIGMGYLLSGRMAGGYAVRMVCERATFTMVSVGSVVRDKPRIVAYGVKSGRGRNQKPPSRLSAKRRRRAEFPMS
jgi:hypothetical protein